MVSLILQFCVTFKPQFLLFSYNSSKDELFTTCANFCSIVSCLIEGVFWSYLTSIVYKLENEPAILIINGSKTTTHKQLNMTESIETWLV